MRLRGRDAAGAVRSLGATGPFLVPAAALAFLDGSGLGPGLLLLAVTAAVVLLEGEDRLGLALGRVPLALLGVGVVVATAPADLTSALFAAAIGLGFLAWLSLDARASEAAGRRLGSLGLPALATVLTLAIAGGLPGLSLGPGGAAFLVVVALLLVALAVGIATPEGGRGGLPEEPGTPSEGS